MRIQKISDGVVTVFLSEEDVKGLGEKDADELKEAVFGIISGACGGLLPCRGKEECEITLDPGYTVTVKAKKRKSPQKPAKKTVFCFDGGKALHTACVFLQSKGVKNGTLLREGAGENAAYYLITEVDDGGDPLWLSSVSELCSGVFTDKNAFLYYICEHGRVIIEKNAVFDIANSEKTW